MADLSPRKVAVRGRFSQGQSSSTRVGLREQTGTLLEIDGQEIHFPTGCTELEVQPRLCGDHYAYIGGRQPVAGYGASPVDAINMALGKLA